MTDRDTLYFTKNSWAELVRELVRQIPPDNGKIFSGMLSGNQEQQPLFASVLVFTWQAPLLAAADVSHNYDRILSTETE